MVTSSRGYGPQTRGRRHTMGFVAAAAAGLIVLCTSSRSEACSCLEPTGIQKSLPENGAQGVPTDVVIWSQGADVELVDEDGDVVPSHLELKWRSASCTVTKLLTPDAALKPTSTYTLRAVAVSETLPDQEVAAINFTTGEGSLGDPAPQSPSIRAAAYEASVYRPSCVSKSQVCMQTSYEGLIDVHLTWNEGEVHYVGYPDMLANLDVGDAAGETCLTVQARDLAGRLSKKTEVCVDFSAAPVFDKEEWYLDCSDERLRPFYVSSDEPEPTGEGGSDGHETNTETDDQDSEVPNEASGCTFPSAGGGAARPLGLGLMSGLASLLLWMRRRCLTCMRR